MSKIAVVGSSDYISGFRGVGASIFPVETNEQARRAFDDILSNNYAIIFLAESFAADLAETLAKLREKPFPIVTLIPDTQESQGLAKMALSASIRKAIGAEDISV
jgi:V/A-type H+-transporting ATPase subunit F